MNEVFKLNVKCPQVLKIGNEEGFSFTVQEKIDGKNGTLCSNRQKLKIWSQLGEFARLYNKISYIAVEEVNKLEFHKNWKSRLRYNIER